MLQLGQNPSEEDLIEMMRLVDVNGDNEIDFDEFLVMMTMRSGERDTEAELREAFKLFDLDGSGTISRDELKTLMKNLGQALTDEEVEAMIDEVDINRDGEISFDEFQALMVCVEVGVVWYKLCCLRVCCVLCMPGLVCEEFVLAINHCFWRFHCLTDSHSLCRATAFLMHGNQHEILWKEGANQGDN